MTDRTVPDAQPLRVGDPDRLGSYELLGRLGEGGQGSVFLGRSQGPMAPADGFVAIKLLHAGLTADPSARGRFVRELEVAKRVARFCTAQVLDADVAGDQPYIVSEYVPGSSLHKLVTHEGPRTGGALERLAISTLTALTAIHQAGIVHRDFKPHNVMLGADGPRVIDFGVARALGAAGETQNVGTPAYMAPEHFNGAPIGPPADLFAWGTTMVFAATGRPAFGNDEMGAVMHRILTGEPDLGELPEPLRQVVAACLAKDPARRPTARQAQERLVGPDIAAGPTEASPRPASVSPFGPPPPARPAASSGSASLPGTASPTGTPAVPGAAGPAGAPGLPGTAGLPGGAGPAGAAAPGGPASHAGHMGRTGPEGQGGPVGTGGLSGATTPAGLPGAAPAPGAPFPGTPSSHRPQRGRLLPAVAAAAVTAVLVGGSVWMVTRSGDGDPAEAGTGLAAPGSDQAQDARLAPGGGAAPDGLSSPGVSPSGEPGRSTKPGKSGRPKGERTSPAGKKSPGGRPGGGGGGGGTGDGGGGSGGGTGDDGPTVESNPYSPEAVCNSGGHGGGYYVQRSSTFNGGTVYQLYNSSGYNCAVTLKTRDVGKSTSVWAKIESQNGGSGTDSGSFQYYAGPVFVYAKGQCVRYSGGTPTGNGSAPWGNCG